jgi:hypothetical protein
VGDAAHLDAGAVVAQRLLEPALHRRVVPARLHVDEVDHDEAGEVAQAELPRDLVRRSMLVRNAVSSMCRSRVERPEFTSMATSASVWLMTT